MTKSRHIHSPRITLTDAQNAELRRRYPHERTENIARDLGVPLEKLYAKAGWMGLKKTPEYLASPDACRLRQGDEVGKAYRYPKGNVPANKGVKGISYPGTEATQFKKGEKPHTWRPIGTERHSKEGYLQRKMTDTGVTRKDYVAVHHLVWREHHGDVPEGYRVTFKDRNKANIVIENLELVSIADMMRRNTLHNYPKELAEIIQLRGAVNRQINKRIKQNGNSNTSTGK
jgi:hypothetical protein